jgi:hypothetical protein
MFLFGSVGNTLGQRNLSGKNLELVEQMKPGAIG